MKRLSILVLLALFAAGAASPALAETSRLSTSVDNDQLEAACDDAGGTFTWDGGLGDAKCVTENCDGEGGNCAVWCDHWGTCWGSTPDRIGPQVYTLVAILQNGDPTVYYHGAGIGSTAGQSSAGGAGGNSGGAPGGDNVYTPHKITCAILGGCPE